MFRCLALLALLAAAQGRAVNISNTWMLPEEGFPVFYRYFRDRISWYEADAVCQFHHANLVTVDTTAQYDAVRAYLKELDISSAVWVGLIRSNPDGDFTWTDYRGLSGEGYWSSAPDTASAPVCAAADPSSDYRWEARACGGPMVASFICELPVPQWASGAEGCMVKSIPALTALYLPESAAVQLTADCGLAGVKRVQCTGSVKRAELLKQLSCGEEINEATSTIADVLNVSSVVLTTEETMSSQDFTLHLTTKEPETETETNPSSKLIFETPSPYDASFSYKYDTPDTNHRVAVMNHIIPMHKGYNIDMIPEKSQNLESNDIPTHLNKEGELTEEQINQIEEEKRIQHKMLHEEIARLGNPKSFEKIFSQSSDHFIPPLVMAKSRDNDDMEEISIQSKHAQQVAEEYKLSHLTTARPPEITTVLMEKSFETTPKVSTADEVKPTKISYRKKYNDKQYESKTKNMKTTKKRIEKVVDYKITPTKNNEDNIELKNVLTYSEPLELTISLKERDDLVKINSTVETTTLSQTTTSAYIQSITTADNNKNDAFTTNLGTTILKDIVQEVEKFTISNDDPNTSPTVIEVSTLIPIFTDVIDKVETTQHSLPQNSSTIPDLIKVMETTKSTDVSTLHDEHIHLNKTVATETSLEATKSVTPTKTTELPTTNAELLTSGVTNTATKQTNVDKGNVQTVPDSIVNITAAVITPTDEIIISNADIIVEPEDCFEESVDADSPLLSAASEPIHRPNRFRRPQSTQNRMKKFALLRILG